MKTATTEQVNASLLRMETGTTSRLLGILVQRVSARTWLIAGDDEMHFAHRQRSSAETCWLLRNRGAISVP
jgi:hypothetical protein